MALEFASKRETARFGGPFSTWYPCALERGDRAKLARFSSRPQLLRPIFLKTRRCLKKRAGSFR
jgi:hypothetical protein